MSLLREIYTENPSLRSRPDAELRLSPIPGSNGQMQILPSALIDRSRSWTS